MEAREQCTGLTKYGTRCKKFAVIGSDPPRCRIHNLLSKAPTIEQPVIDAVILDLWQKQVMLSAAIDSIGATGNIPLTIDLMKIHAQNASRLGRLMRDKMILAGLSGDALDEAVQDALDELAVSLEIDV